MTWPRQDVIIALIDGAGFEGNSTKGERNEAAEYLYLEAGWTIEAISIRLHLTERSVYRYLAHLRAPGRKGKFK